VIHLLFPLAGNQRVGARVGRLVEPVGSRAGDDGDPLDPFRAELEHPRVVRAAVEGVEPPANRPGRKRLARLADRPDRDRTERPERFALREADRVGDAGGVAQLLVSIERKV